MSTYDNIYSYYRNAPVGSKEKLIFKNVLDEFSQYHPTYRKDNPRVSPRKEGDNTFLYQPNDINEINRYHDLFKNLSSTKKDFTKPTKEVTPANGSTTNQLAVTNTTPTVTKPVEIDYSKMSDEELLKIANQD